MSRKTLLTESEIRKFLKLADLGAVGDAKIQEMYGMPGARDDEEPEMDAGMDDEPDMDMDAEPDMDMDAEPDMDDDPADAGDSKMVSVEDFMGALESALEDVMGEPTSVEMDMDDEADAADDDMEMDMGMDAAPDMGADDEEEPAPMMEEDQIVNEVARRVAARLSEKNKPTNVINKEIKNAYIKE